MLELSPRYLKILLSILQEHVPGMNVLAYGSRVKGLSHPGSDLDLVVIHPGNPRLPQKNMGALRKALIESNLPIHVDVLDWAKISDSFHDEINQNCECIFGAMEQVC